MRMVKRVSRSRWGRIGLSALTLCLVSAALAGLGVGVNEAQAQSPQMTISGTALGGKPGQGPLSKANFNHKKHEDAMSGNCDVCHHMGSQDPCTQCHTSQGSPDGNNIQLSDAMHNPTAKQSCVGCHQIQTKKPECAGCHRNIAPGPRKSNCAVCHTDLAAQTPCQIQAPAAPDSVAIGSLSKIYEPCTVFDHASHLQHMKDAAKGALPKAFHSNDAALCAGCHHHTPVGQTPPKCGTCHGQAFQDQDPSRPGLKAAYHIQCNQCHKTMMPGSEPVAPTDCKGCHAPKK